jgi:hypothetical protein
MEPVALSISSSLLNLPTPMRMVLSASSLVRPIANST